MKIVNSCYLLIFGLLLFTGEVSLWAQVRANRLEIFPIESSPNPEEWRAFFQMSPEDRQRLWEYHQKRGKTLKDWSWEWRLGWAKACARSVKPYCEKTLENLLDDPAMVVRAEAASLIGDKYQGTGSKRAMELLIRAYKNPSNIRNKKPLWVQFRILEAIKKVGAEGFENKGESLSGQFSATKSYWQKLNKF